MSKWYKASELERARTPMVMSSEMAGDGYLVWTQPTGAHNAYNTGDIVHYPTKEDQLYQSQIDGNTTIPGSDERWWKVYSEE